MRRLRFALPKGRLLEPSLRMLRACGIGAPCPDHTDGSALIDRSGPIDWIFVRDADICAYVDDGAADIGIVGSDQIEECSSRAYQPVELDFGRCTLDMIGRDLIPPDGTASIRMASKYPKIASAWAAAEKLDATVIELSGSVELALVLGLTDYVIDIVETGRTLRQHGLVSIRTLMNVRAMLLVNQQAWRTRSADVQPIVRTIDAVVRTEVGS